MKYFTLLFFCFQTWILNAQTRSFEGIMTWKVKAVVVDAREEAIYEKEIIREDNAEINQAIQELERQLIDPEMQYLLLENPTIKSNMQKRITELKAALAENLENPDNTIFPHTLEIFLKNQNSYTKVEGGNMAKLTGNMLYLHSDKTTYFIKDASKTYSILNDTTKINRNDSIISLVKTQDTLFILKYPCIKFILTTKENTDIRTSYIWVTQSIKNMNPASFRSLAFTNGNLHHEAFKRMDGIPLKIMVFEKGFQLSMEVSDISTTLISDSNFSIPYDYKESVWGF